MRSLTCRLCSCVSVRVESEAKVMQTDVHYSKCINLTTLVRLKPKLSYLGDLPLLSALLTGGRGGCGLHNQAGAHKAYCNVIGFAHLAVITTYK